VISGAVEEGQRHGPTFEPLSVPGKKLPQTPTGVDSERPR
jgi:hypothetical protein